MNIDINSRILEKLLGLVASGVREIHKDVLGRQRAKWRSEERLIEARTERQVRDLMDANVATAENAAIDRGLDRESAMQTREVREAQNIRDIVVEAAQSLEGEEVEDYESDGDWAAHFFDGAANVSNHDLQQIWARILAHEARAPGTTSKRTITALRHLSRDEARRFADLAEFVLRGNSVFYQESYTDEFAPLDFTNLILIEDSGLIEGVPGRLSIPITLSSIQSDEFDDLLEYQGGVLRFCNGSETKLADFSIPCARLSVAGRELMRIIAPKPNMRYLQQIAAFAHTTHAEMYYIPNSLGKVIDRPFPFERIWPIEPGN